VEGKNTGTKLRKKSRIVKRDYLLRENQKKGKVNLKRERGEVHMSGKARGGPG